VTRFRLPVPTPIRGLARQACSARSGARRSAVSTVAVRSVSSTSLSPCNSHSSPAQSMRANGRSRSQPTRSKGPQPSAAACAAQRSRKRPTSSTKRSRRLAGTSPGGRSGSSRAKPAAQALEMLRRIGRLRRARPRLRTSASPMRLGRFLYPVQNVQNVQNPPPMRTFAHFEHSEQCAETRMSALAPRLAARRNARASGSSRCLP